MPEQIILYSAGAIPGIPGEVTPGIYTVDADARTATFVEPLPDTQADQQVPISDTPSAPVDTSTPALSDPPPAIQSSSN